MGNTNFLEIAKNAKAASLELANLPTELKNKALTAIAKALEANVEKIINANQLDLDKIGRAHV